MRTPTPDIQGAGGELASSQAGGDPAVRLAAAHDRAGQLLTDRYADGTVGDAEFEAYLARLREATDLVTVEGIVAELEAAARRAPVATRQPGAGLALPPDEQRLLAVMTEIRRRGPWRVPRTLRVRAVMADVKLDFRHTVIPSGLLVDVRSVMASVTLIVPPDVAVAFDVFGFLGSANCDAPEPHASRPGTPAMAVTGSAVMGEVKVVIRDPSR